MVAEWDSELGFLLFWKLAGNPKEEQKNGLLNSPSSKKDGFLGSLWNILLL